MNKEAEALERRRLRKVVEGWMKELDKEIKQAPKDKVLELMQKRASLAITKFLLEER